MYIYLEILFLVWIRKWFNVFLVISDIGVFFGEE